MSVRRLDEATAPAGEAPDEVSFRPVKSADRTLDILEALASGTVVRPTLGELSRMLEIPKSSLHGILRTMEARGWVELDDGGGRFGLGVRALLVGAAYVDVDPDVAAAGSALDWLADQTGETVHQGRLQAPDVIYLAKRESTHPLRMFSAIGRRLPAHTTALGKAILATRDDEVVRELLQRPLSRLTEHTITREADLLRELDATRRRGFAVDNEENTEGMRCFAAAIPVHGGESDDALSISIPVARLRGKRIGELGGLVREASMRARRP